MSACINLFAKNSRVPSNHLASFVIFDYEQLMAEERTNTAVTRVAHVIGCDGVDIGLQLRAETRQYFWFSVYLITPVKHVD